MGKTMRALGLMSGTSMDGIDVALIETDGEDRLAARAVSATFAYSAERPRPADGRPSTRPAPGAARRAARRLPCRAQLIERRSRRRASIADAQRSMSSASMARRCCTAGRHRSIVIGFHGQTVLHRAAERTHPDRAARRRRRCWPSAPASTWSTTCAPPIARPAAQGAPLVPVYHRALAAKLPERPVAVLNIGGVANVTWIGRDGTLLAFDTGPGNALIDDWMARHTGASLDADGGALPPRGRVDEDAPDGAAHPRLFRQAAAEVARPQRLLARRRSQASRSRTARRR